MTRVELPNPWMRIPARVQEPRLRLFCFPFAGGSSVIYRDWPQYLPADIEVIAVELPGRGTRIREKPYRQIPPLLDSFGPHALPYLDRPFAFFGHSLGARIAFEFARWLGTHHHSLPIHIFLSAQKAPHLPTKKEDLLHELSDKEFTARLRKLGGTPPIILQEPDLMDFLMPLLRADCSLAEEKFDPSIPPINIDFTVFGGLQDEEAPTDSLEAWKMHTKGSCNLQMFPGDHFFLNSSQGELLEQIKKHLIQDNQEIENK